MSLKVGISCCPNDIYTYAGLLTKNISNSYDFEIGQISELNQWCLDSTLDFGKISAGTYPSVSQNYNLLSVGASFGVDNGPKLVFRKGNTPSELEDIEIATPGVTTTASFVVSKLFPLVRQTQRDLKEIPKLVSEGKYIGGIVINESMGNLECYGLEVKYDLSKLWFEKMRVPLPLGIVVAKNELAKEVVSEFESKVRRSFLWSKENNDKALKLCSLWSSEKNLGVNQKHISSFTAFAEDNAKYEHAIEIFLEQINA